MARRCRWPPDRLLPPSCRAVCRPSWLRQKSARFTCSSAAQSSASVASGFAMRRFASTVPLKMVALWGTSVRARRRWARCSCSTGTPPSVTLPV